jgi:hypothetical protein
LSTSTSGAGACATIDVEHLAVIVEALARRVVPCA